jgi:hypothetical protein
LGLLNYKTLFVLLFVVVLNVAVFILLWQLNFFVHGDLYNYGLVFSSDWAEGVWHNNLSCWAFILGATAFTIVAMIPHYMQSRKPGPSHFLAFTGFLLSACAIVYEALAIFFLNQLDTIVRTALYDFGIPPSFDWSATYEPLMGTAYALTTISLLTLIIPAVRSLGIIKIEIIDEEE